MEEKRKRDEREKGRTKLLNMHGPNGTGRGRDKGQLIFPAFHFVPSLFYFGANCYRYSLRHRRWPPFLLPRRPRRQVVVNNLKFFHRYLILSTILSKEPLATVATASLSFLTLIRFYIRINIIDTCPRQKFTTICRNVRHSTPAR